MLVGLIVIIAGILLWLSTTIVKNATNKEEALVKSQNIMNAIWTQASFVVLIYYSIYTVVMLQIMSLRKTSDIYGNIIIISLFIYLYGMNIAAVIISPAMYYISLSLHSESFALLMILYSIRLSNEDDNDNIPNTNIDEV